MPDFPIVSLAAIQLSPNGKTMLVVALILYFVGLLAVSIYAAKNVKTEQDFLVAGRRLPLHLSWGALMATWFGSSAIMGATKNSFESGVGGTVLDPFACSATLLLTGFVFASRLWRMQLFTMADFYQKKYGTVAEFMACLIQVPTFFCWIGAQYVSLAALAGTYFGFDKLPVILVCAVIILSYTLIGGMWSVTLTDAIQILIAIIGLVVLGFAVAYNVGDGNVFTGVSTVLQKSNEENRLSLITSWHPYALMAVLGTFLTGLLGNIPGQDLQQRIFSSESERTASLSCILSGILYIIFGLIPVFLGLAAHLYLSDSITAEDLKAERILPIMAGTYLGDFMGGIMVVVFIIAVIAIVVSVATSASISQAAILASNVLGRWQTSDTGHLSLDRFCILVVTAGSIGVALSGESIMGLLDIQLSIAMCSLFVPLVMGVFGKPLGQLSGWLPMVAGLLFWSCRETFQRFIYPIKDFVEGQESGAIAEAMQYPEYVSSIATGALKPIISAYAWIPPDIQGLGASFIAYFVAQLLIRRGFATKTEYIAEDI